MRPHTRCAGLLLSVATCALAACSGTGTPLAPPIQPTQALRAPVRQQSARGISKQAKAQGILFISNRDVGDVEMFDESNPRKTLGKITNGLDGPGGIAVDASGNLFVANGANNTVVKYAAPYTGAPVTTYSTGSGSSNQPTDVTVAPDGTLYVSQIVGGQFQAGQVIEFPSNSTKISLTLSVIAFPTYMTTDAKGNLFVAVEGPADVEEFAPGSTQGTLLNLSGLLHAAGIAFDQSGNLLVADPGAGNGTSTVDIFPPGSKTPSSHLGNFFVAEGIALTRDQSQLFVGESHDPANPSNVFELTYPGGASLQKIKNEGFDVAVSPRANR